MSQKTQKKEIKLKPKEFEEFMDNLVDSFDKEYLDSPMFKHFIENSKYLDDPDDLHTMIQFPFKRALELAIVHKLKKSKEVASIYLNYNFLETHISRLCSDLYGSACSVDRGRFIVKSYIKFKETGKMPKLDWKREYTFHYPESGTMKQWMNLVKETYSLKYGFYKGYLQATLDIAMSKKHPEHLKKIKDYEKKQKKEKKNG